MPLCDSKQQVWGGGCVQMQAVRGCERSKKVAGMVHSDYMHGCIVETGMARKGHREKKGHKTNHRAYQRGSTDVCARCTYIKTHGHHKLGKRTYT